MAEAQSKLVTRIVKGPKPIHGYDKDGKKCLYGIGDKIELTPNAAKSFARYLISPEVAEAEAKVAEATAKDARIVADAAKRTANVPAPAAAPKATAGGGAKAS